MTPREKAAELVYLFKYELIEQAKQYALIVVEEIINEFYTHPIAKIYWEEVKQEIEKLCK